MGKLENYLTNRIRTAIEILELEIKKDKEALETGSYKETKNPPYEPWDGELLKHRLKINIHEKKRLEKQLHDR